MTVRPDVGDEVSVDDLLARIAEVTGLNQMIREGLAAAERGETESG